MKSQSPKIPKDVLGSGGKSKAYSVTKDGKIKLHRDLTKWRLKVVGRNHAIYTDVAPSSEATREKEFKAVISRCTKELSLDSECALAVKDMRKQEYLDHLAG